MIETTEIKPMKIDIILLTYQHSDLTVKCLESIKWAAEIDYRIIWVDNGSFQFHCLHVLETLQNLEMEFLPIRLKENRGFAGGINAGMREVETEFFVIMNNDVEVKLAWDIRLIRPLFESSDVGVVGPVTDNIGSIQQKDKFMKKYGSYNMPEHFQVHDGNISYFCTAMRKELIEKVGYLDENFFNGGEDDDYNDRVRAAGYEVGIAPSAWVQHKHRATRHDPALFPTWKATDEQNREYLKKKRAERAKS